MHEARTSVQERREARAEAKREASAAAASAAEQPVAPKDAESTDPVQTVSPREAAEAAARTKDRQSQYVTYTPVDE